MLPPARPTTERRRAIGRLTLATRLAAMLFLALPLSLRADDCDVCPRTPDAAAAVPPPLETGDCDVCAKAESAAPAPESTGAMFRDCPTCPEMVPVPPGSFTLAPGPGTTAPARRLIFERGFALSRYAVSVDEWDACVAAGPCARTTDQVAGGGRDAVNVARQDIALYAAWLTGLTGRHYRLATDAELAYAASTAVRAVPVDDAPTAGFRIVRAAPP